MNAPSILMTVIGTCLAVIFCLLAYRLVLIAADITGFVFRHWKDKSSVDLALIFLAVCINLAIVASGGMLFVLYVLTGDAM